VLRAVLLARRTRPARAVIGDAPVKVASRPRAQGWDAIIGSDGAFVGMHGFGASAPHTRTLQALRHYAEKVAEAR
jgi:transketolase